MLYLVPFFMGFIERVYWLELQVSDIFSDSPFRVFADTLKSGGIIKVLCVPSGAKNYSNTALKKGDIYNEAIKSGAKGLPYLKVMDDGKHFFFFLFASPGGWGVMCIWRWRDILVPSLTVLTFSFRGSWGNSCTCIKFGSHKQRAIAESMLCWTRRYYVVCSGSTCVSK